MESRLVHHPASAPAVLLDIVASAAIAPSNILTLDYSVSGPIEEIALPANSTGQRTDGLWQTTCFECFVSLGSEAYLEFNASPSGDWAAYAFAAYRSEMLAFEPAVAPSLSVEVSQHTLHLRAEFDLGALVLDREHAALGLSAVIEARQGQKSYWALAHREAKPDFHDPRGFILKLQGV